MPGKKRVIGLFVLFVIAFFSYILYRDLHMDEEYLKNMSPDMVIELSDVNFKRGNKDDLWLFSVKSIERIDGLDTLTGVAGTREGLDGSRWSLISPGGEFVESNDILSLRDGRGTFVDDRESFNWSAPEVYWMGNSSDMWSFPSGIVVSGDKYNMTGSKGEASPSGKLYLQEGVVQWLNE